QCRGPPGPGRARGPPHTRALGRRDRGGGRPAGRCLRARGRAVRDEGRKDLPDPGGPEMTRLLLLALIGAAAGAMPFTGTASGLDAGVPADAHYELTASIDPHGRLQSSVEISFREPQDAFTFILGNRFHIEEIKAVDGHQVATEPVDRPVPNLKKVTVSAADP